MIIEKILEPLFESYCYVVIDQESRSAIIIDPNDYVQIHKLMIDKGLKIDYIILTHEHYDHVSGLNRLRDTFHGKVIASKTCSKNLLNISKNMQRTFGVYLHFMGKEYKGDIPDYHCKEADMVFEGEEHMVWCGNSIYLVETRGHSAGSICIILDNEYLFSGDSLLWGKTIVTKFLGGDQKEYEEYAMPVFRKLDSDLQVLPGHGNEFRLGDKII